jgi:hypothetical protein
MKLKIIFIAIFIIFSFSNLVYSQDCSNKIDKVKLKGKLSKLVNAIDKEYDDNYYANRQEAMESLRVNYEDILCLLKNNENMKGLLTGIGYIGDEKAIQILRNRKPKDIAEELYIASIFCQLGYEYDKNINKLIDELNTNKNGEEDYVAYLLGLLEDTRAIIPLMNAYKHSDGAFAEDIINSLIKICMLTKEPVKAIEIISGNKDENWRVQELRNYVLGEIGRYKPPK